VPLQAANSGPKAHEFA